MQRSILRKLKRIRFINGIRRVLYATTYYNRRYVDIFNWGIESREDTNYTYDLKESNLSYLAHTIAVVTKTEYKTVYNFIKEAQDDLELTNHILDTTRASPYAPFADLRTGFAKRLGWYAFVRITKPKVVVETGIDKGLGSVLLCSALLKNKSEGFPGKYFGTDINPDAGYLLTGKYKEIGSVLYGDSIQSLKAFNHSIDLFINDSDHSEQYEYDEYLTIKPLLKPTSIILGDNSHVTDKLAQFSTENERHFLFFKEEPANHWYPGGGIGISYL